MGKQEPIEHWNKAADEAEQAGLQFAARLYRQTARSLEIEAETGLLSAPAVSSPSAAEPFISDAPPAGNNTPRVAVRHAAELAPGTSPADRGANHGSKRSAVNKRQARAAGECRRPL